MSCLAFQGLVLGIFSYKVLQGLRAWFLRSALVLKRIVYSDFAKSLCGLIRV